MGCKKKKKDRHQRLKASLKNLLTSLEDMESPNADSDDLAKLELSLDVAIDRLENLLEFLKRKQEKS